LEITTEQLEKLVTDASAKGAEAAVRAVNTVKPEDRPGGAGDGVAAPAVNLHRPSRPSIARAIRALQKGSWKGAELERDLSQATAAIYGKGVRDEDDDSVGDGLMIPSTPYAYANVLEQAAIRTPASVFGSAAVRALAEGTSALGSVTSAGALVPIQFLSNEFVIALTSAVALRNMPEVRTVPVNSNIIELPRESAQATTAAVAENGTISSADPTFAVQELALKKQAALRTFSNELIADSNPAIDSYIMQTLARDIALFQDLQYLEGSGSGANVNGLVNYSGLTTSSWAAATNGSTPGADDLVKLPYDIFKANGRPTAFIMHPRTLQNIALLKDGAGRYLFTDVSVWGGPMLQVTKDGFTYPSAAVGKLLGYPVYLSTQISTTRTQGSASTATNIYYGDFRNLVILERQAINVFLSAHFAMNNDQTAVRATARSTVALLQPTAFAKATGIL
jgi:HK97 family phage major capsid protein